MGSDGLYDMTLMDDPADILALATNTSTELCSKATARWKQVWDVQMPDNGPIQNIKFDRNGYDDVSVTIIEVTAI